MTARIALACCVLVALAAGCRDGSGRWNAEEREQILAFTTSVTKADEAGPVTADVEEASAAIAEALAAADAVTDPVLRRIHPELPEQYRTQFVPALRMRLASLEAARSGGPTTSAQLQWQIPMAAWGDWYDRNLPALREAIQ